MKAFRRITSGGNFIPQIDGLRFIAITLVVMLHLNSYSNLRLRTSFTSFDLGWRGVQLFFVLSGFILGLPFAKHYLANGKAVDIKRYFLRRLTRLEPPYILCLILLYQFVHSTSLSHLLASLFYVHSQVFGEHSTVNAVTWSLEIEIQFYCLMPLLALLYRLRHRRAWMAALIATFSVAVMFISAPRFDLSILANIQFFLAGMLLADIYTSGLPKQSAWWDAVALFLWPTVLLVPGRWYMALLPAVCLSTYTAAFCGPVSRRVLSLPLLTTIGGMCYTIYLFHYHIAGFMSLHIHRSGVYYPVTVIAIALFCSAFFLLVERPCMNPHWPQDVAAIFRSNGRAQAAAVSTVGKSYRA
jgi:peptidoglycan/LPS O-acetylase OafA/YrhL